MTATTTKKVLKTSTGAPSQLGQSSRKGKKAWRKHVDVHEVESGLEEVRAEERETGSSLRSKANGELFLIDVKGDDNIRKHLPKFDKSELSYVKRLSYRSAVPAVFSRPSLSSSSITKKHVRITAEDKKRLLRISKRKQLGPFNSVQDPTELGCGSAILDPTHAVKRSGTYDIWTASSLQDRPKLSPEKKDFLTPIVEKPSVKPPRLPDHRKDIALPAVIPPHEGASYNPPVAAHQELLRLAHEKAEEKEKDAERHAVLKEKIEKAKKAQWSGSKPGVPIGMQVDDLEDPEKDEVGEEKGERDLPPPKKPPVRKTKQQRKKAEKLRVEKRALSERLAQKRYLSSLPSVKTTRKSIERALSIREQSRIQRRLLLTEKLRRSGMAGKRIGKHVVPEGETEVQLGEDLSESLRGLKVEGNLFRDRFLSLQHRALLEPRVPVMPKKHRPITKEVEKFAWKRFE